MIALLLKQHGNQELTAQHLSELNKEMHFDKLFEAYFKYIPEQEGYIKNVNVSSLFTHNAENPYEKNTSVLMKILQHAGMHHTFIGYKSLSASMLRIFFKYSSPEAQQEAATHLLEALPELFIPCAELDLSIDTDRFIFDLLKLANPVITDEQAQSEPYQEIINYIQKHKNQLTKNIKMNATVQQSIDPIRHALKCNSLLHRVFRETTSIGIHSTLFSDQPKCLGELLTLEETLIVELSKEEEFEFNSLIQGYLQQDNPQLSQKAFHALIHHTDELITAQNNQDPSLSCMDNLVINALLITALNMKNPPIAFITMLLLQNPKIEEGIDHTLVEKIKTHKDNIRIELLKRSEFDKNGRGSSYLKLATDESTLLGQVYGETQSIGFNTGVQKLKQGFQGLFSNESTPKKIIPYNLSLILEEVGKRKSSQVLQNSNN